MHFRGARWAQRHTVELQRNSSIFMSSSRGQLLVVSAPSGAGKTSLVRALMARDPSLRFSISFTTRLQRPSEEHGRDYFFVDRTTFERMACDGEFLEHARVFDNSYGTSRRQVDDLLAAGANVILEIDWQGAQQIRAKAPECRSIFILPPSRMELERRLRDRKTDSEEVIARRLRDSTADISHWREFDYVVINDDFERAIADLQSIVAGRGEHLHSTRAELESFVAKLIQK
jgi:guanylate kinase